MRQEAENMSRAGKNVRILSRFLLEFWGFFTFASMKAFLFVKILGFLQNTIDFLIKKV